MDRRRRLPASRATGARPPGFTSSAPGAARGIQIDIDSRMLGFRYPTELNLVGDAAQTLPALLPRLQPKADRSWRERIEDWAKGDPDTRRFLRQTMKDLADSVLPQPVAP